MSLILRTPWTRQPQVAVGVDWGNPLSRGLIVASSPGKTGVNAADGQRLVVAAGTAPSPTRLGIALDQSAGANAAYFPANLPGGSTAYTLLTIAANINETRSAFALMLGDEVANGNSQIRLGLNTSATGAAAAGRFALVEYGLGVYKTQLDTAASTYVDNAPHVYGAVRNGANASLWYDGVNVASNSTASGSVTLAQRVYVSGSGNSLTSSVNKQVLALAWLRALSAAEMAAVSANPWQLFAPLPRRIWAPVAASGPVTHATDGGLIGSGAATAGSAARFRALSTSGVLAGQSSAVVGAADRAGGAVTHDNTGALIGPAAVVAGSAARSHLFASTGSLVGPGALLSGAATRGSEFPDPSVVLAGVQYGPGGIYVGTLTVGLSETRISLRSFTGRF